MGLILLGILLLYIGYKIDNPNSCDYGEYYSSD